MHVGHVGEDLLPVATDLIAAAETSRGMRGRLVLVVVGEAGHQRVQVVGVGGLQQPVDEGIRVVHVGPYRSHS